MILGVDVGTRTFGYAVVTPRTGRVLELGELFQDGAGHASAGAANAARAHAQAQLLEPLVERYGVTMIAGEARSLGGPPNARVSMAAAQSSCWGMLAGLAARYGLGLVEVGPKVWQGAVVGAVVGAGRARSRQIDYDEVAAALEAFIEGRAREQLAAIPAGRRSHALDGAGVGIFAAVRPAQVVVVARPRISKVQRGALSFPPAAPPAAARRG